MLAYDVVNVCCFRVWT